tara:strand:- start:40 stop:567 length:528 start_codon:yes stop_codon:yes gene_type:complete
MDTVQSYLDQLNFNLQVALANPYVQSLMLIFFIMYAGLAAPALPTSIARLFDYTLFKVLILALILYVNNFSPQIALLVAVGFFISLQTLSRSKVFDLAGEVSRIRKLIGMQNGEAVEAPAHETGQVDEADFYGLDADSDTQVSGLAARTQSYQGPQGMKHPMGYGGEVDGADAQF